MKKIRDIVKGDSVLVKCDIISPDWIKETVTETTICEDGYKGSGHWCMRIQTDKSVHNCPDDVLKTGVHWPILIKSLGQQYVHTTDANPRHELKIKHCDMDIIIHQDGSIPGERLIKEFKTRGILNYSMLDGNTLGWHVSLKGAVDYAIARFTEPYNKEGFTELVYDKENDEFVPKKKEEV